MALIEAQETKQSNKALLYMYMNESSEGSSSTHNTRTHTLIHTHVHTCTHTHTPQVGDAENTPTVTNLYEEEDSDGEVLDSTDWETSSGGEEAEEVR